MIAYDPNEVYVVPAPQENVHGRYEVDAPYFDASLLEEIPDVVPTLPRAYQPEDALPMPPVLTLAPTPSPPVPEQAPPQRRPGIVPTAPAASDSAEMPDWSFIDESRPEDDPLASFGTKAAAAAEDDRTKDDPLEDDPFAGLR